MTTQNKPQAGEVGNTTRHDGWGRGSVNGSLFSREHQICNPRSRLWSRLAHVASFARHPSGPLIQDGGEGFFLGGKRNQSPSVTKPRLSPPNHLLGYSRPSALHGPKISCLHFPRSPICGMAHGVVDQESIQAGPRPAGQLPGARKENPTSARARCI